MINMDESAYQCKLNKVGSTIKVLALPQYAGLALRTTPRGPPGNHPTPGGARAPERTRKSRLEQTGPSTPMGKTVVFNHTAPIRT